ncbi:MAG: hydantoinase B/oxoprolinase family protein [Planctomycetaceae bacterium]
MWRFWIDVGGTFTDCLALSPTGEISERKTLSSGRIKGQVQSVERDGDSIWIVDALRNSDVGNFWKDWSFDIVDNQGKTTWSGKILSSHPKRGIQVDAAKSDHVFATGTGYELSSELEAPVVCIRQVLGLPMSVPVPEVDVRLGTTRGTNALLERKGARTALITTQGFGDVLRIGSQERPHLFELSIRKSQPLCEIEVEIEERIDTNGQVLKSPEAHRIREQLQQLRDDGIQSLAVCFVNAFQNADHELLVESIARELGFSQISRSSEVAPAIKFVPRTQTTVLDAYLTPVLQEYVERISRQLGNPKQFRMMTSAGGLIDARQFRGKDSILSGPAGGVIGYSQVATAAGFSESIGFDMGGTSTDVSRFGGELEIETETEKAGIRIVTPTLAIETVAAGGGSICRFDGVQLHVGPESAGANPGPACYGRGGPLTVTDLNLALGRLLPSKFPFPLDVHAVESRLAEMCDAIKQSPLQADYSPTQLAQGLIDIANETMVRAIRRISTQRGFDPANHVLVSFGGSGGLHACALASSLGMSQVLIHPYAGILSAYGIGLADVRRQSEFSVLKPLTDDTLTALDTQLQHIEESLRDEVTAEGIRLEELQPPHRVLILRYRGVESPLPVEWKGQDIGQIREAYEVQHEQCYGYRHSSREIEIQATRVEVVGNTARPVTPVVDCHKNRREPSEQTLTWIDGQETETAVFMEDGLRPGDEIIGPALVCGKTSTLFVEPNWSLSVNGRGEMLLAHIEEVADSHSSDAESRFDLDAVDPVLLELFNNRFASIAEQMGVVLQKTSISTNVKERLDYSCAVFDACGNLVVNAPHIPVHLGAMSQTVKAVLDDNPDMAPGDVYITNDPYRGGSHLPDVTVVTPVHHAQTGRLLFFTASRAHHAEIGGISPGSMPPFSKNLAEEGVLIQNLKLVDGKDSTYDGYDKLRELLSGGPYPSRNVADNLADVAAQVAANRMGASLLLELIEQPPGRKQGGSSEFVLAYMAHIQRAAKSKTEMALTRFLNVAAPGETSIELSSEDFLDDGARIRATITVSRAKESSDAAGTRVTFDFTGTDAVLATNLNANRAIVSAAMMYVLRCLIDESIPLNSGVLEPVELVLPECLLNPPRRDNPADCAAMVGGNVETSQRVVDVLLDAFGLAAGSQGTMNNFTFGNEQFGYYETICGGSGATATANGASAVQTHMTNTRMTDVEVIERRYPVRVNSFAIRTDSGGKGQYSGGNGIVREMEFRQPLTVSLLTQRRGPFHPKGYAGGHPGAIGRNQLKRRGTTAWETLPGATQVHVEAGDTIRLLTPGGGGWGIVEADSSNA